MTVPEELKPLVTELATWPRWVLAALATGLVALAIWVLTKVVKVALQVLLVLVIVAGVGLTGWLVLH